MSVNKIILSLKTIVNELDFQRKTVVIQWNIRKEDPQLFAIKSTEKVSDPINFF